MAPSATAVKAVSAVAAKHAPLDSYRVSSSQQAFDLEHEHAAHNYHPLPVVFAKAQGLHVWSRRLSLIF